MINMHKYINKMIYCLYKNENCKKGKIEFKTI